MRIAILIADSPLPEFQRIKSEFHPNIWEFCGAIEASIFYVRGRTPRKFENVLNRATDKYRYTKFWPFQNLFDRFEMNRFNRKMPGVTFDNNNLLVDIPAGLRFLGVEMQAAYNFLFNMGFEIVFRTTLSTVVNQKAFVSQVSRIPLDKPFYGGNVINFGKHPFVSGANTFINLKAWKKVTENISKWNHGFLDDVALGRILEGRVPATNIPGINLGNIQEVEQLQDYIIEETSTFRCRTFTSPRSDSEVMRALLGRIKKI